MKEDCFYHEIEDYQMWYEDEHLYMRNSKTKKKIKIKEDEFNKIIYDCVEKKEKVNIEKYKKEHEIERKKFIKEWGFDMLGEYEHHITIEQIEECCYNIIKKNKL
tara:strand:+ start:753 stop:1067 length:315 start_codon:yes stop_codon:yes gene_type:complete